MIAGNLLAKLPLEGIWLAVAIFVGVVVLREIFIRVFSDTEHRRR